MIGEKQFCCYKCAGISFSIRIPCFEEGHSAISPMRAANGEKIDFILTCLNPNCSCKITCTSTVIEGTGTLSESD